MASPEDTTPPVNEEEADIQKNQTQDQIVLQTNELLHALGFDKRAFAKFEDLVASVSSMSVAVYEKLFAFRLENIVRVPNKPEHYVQNAQVVLDALSGALLDFERFDDNTNITGQALCDGQLDALTQLLAMFRHVYDILHAADSLRYDQHDQDGPAEKEEQQQLQPKQSSSMNQRVKKKKSVKQLAKLRPKKNAALEDSKDSSRVTPLPPKTRVKAKAKANGLAADAAPVRRIKKRTRRNDHGIEKASRDEFKQRHQTDNKEEKEDGEADKQEIKQPAQEQLKDFMPVTAGTNPSFESHEPSSPAVDKQETMDDGLFFGGVSSVSLATSEQNDHDFSQLSLNEHLSVEEDELENEIQQDEEVENQNYSFLNAAERVKLRTENTLLSPIKKKNAREPQDDTTQPTRPVLYPLTPAPIESLSHKESLRYRIALKDHLQELRQREVCHRKRLERTFHLGEHAANVEKIRARRLQQDLRLQRISHGMHQKSLEEKELRDTMNHLLLLEKERLREEHRHTSTVLKSIQKEHHKREAAMATFYSNQIEMVKEQTQREVKEREMIEKARKMASYQLLREMRRDREDQLHLLVEQKKHVAEVQRFRNGSRLASALLSTPPPVSDLAISTTRKPVTSTPGKPNANVRVKPTSSVTKPKQAAVTTAKTSLSKTKVQETMRIYGVPKHQRQDLLR